MHMNLLCEENKHDFEYIRIGSSDFQIYSVKKKTLSLSMNYKWQIKLYPKKHEKN